MWGSSTSGDFRKSKTSTCLILDLLDTPPKVRLPLFLSIIIISFIIITPHNGSVNGCPQARGTAPCFFVLSCNWCSEAAFRILCGCSLATPWLLYSCSLGAPWLIHGCSIAAPWLLPGCSLVARWLLCYFYIAAAAKWLICFNSLAAPLLLLDFSRAAPYSMVAPWLLHSYSMVAPWLLYGCSMAAPWRLHNNKYINNTFKIPWKALKHLKDLKQTR